MILQTVLLFLTCSVLAFAQSDSPWAWRCADEATAKCSKERKVEGSLGQMTLLTCKLTCGPYGSLFPFPSQVNLGKTISRFAPETITRGVINCLPGVCPLINEAIDIFEHELLHYHPDYTHDIGIKIFNNPTDPAPQPGEKLTLNIDIDTADIEILLTTNESYTLTVETKEAAVTVNIKAPNFFGARHALETLNQLIDYEEEQNTLQIVSHATISDEPAYRYRGIIVDTSRNFIPVEQLQKIINGMSFNKLNTFHWHISDSQSFPLKMETLLDMTRFGAYSHRHTYNASQIRELVHYAKVRGVRIVPEIDAPAHTGHGWQWGPDANLGNLVVCLDKQPWEQFCAGPPCGQLNIANPNIYKVLSTMYEEIIGMFGPLELFHYGGDEIFLSCWNSTDEITTWMTANNKKLTPESFFNEWGIFQEKVYQLVNKANKDVPVTGILWTSELTNANRLQKFVDNKKYIVQVWTNNSDPVIADLLHKGYQIILSNYDKLYFDCGFGSWVADGNNWCSPYKGWQGVYENDLSVISERATGKKNVNDQILGSEAAVWTEQIDENTIDSIIWPRAAALAERLWSNPKTNYRAAESRLLEQRKRLVQRDIRAGRLQPEWCRQNTGGCHETRPELRD